LELAERGYSQGEIAEALGVSVKTVYRDLRKLRRYWKAEERRFWEEFWKKFWEDLDRRLEALPLEERLLLLDRAMGLELGVMRGRRRIWS